MRVLLAIGMALVCTISPARLSAQQAAVAVGDTGSRRPGDQREWPGGWRLGSRGNH